MGDTGKRKKELGNKRVFEHSNTKPCSCTQTNSEDLLEKPSLSFGDELVEMEQDGINFVQ